MDDQSRALPELPATPPVSYVMPVLNEAGYLPDAVATILSQDYAGEVEIVLALGPSTDGTSDVAVRLAASDSRVVLVDNPDSDIPKALNAAIQASRHPVIVRVDAHSELPPGYTTTAVETLRRTGAGNVGGVMRAAGRTPVQRAVARAYNSPFGLGGGVYHHGDEEGPAESAYLGVFRREALVAAGGFDEEMRRAEDWELNQRIIGAGYLVWFTPSLAVTYWPRASFGALRRQMYSTGVWRGHLVRREGHTPWRYVAPPIAAIIVGVSVLGALMTALGMVRGGAAKVFWPAHAATIAYTAGVTAVGATLGGDGIVDRALNVAALATMHLSWGVGFVKGFTAGGADTVDRSRL